MLFKLADLTEKLEKNPCTYHKYELGDDYLPDIFTCI